jgi:DNA-binding response OmpR family regulator
LARIIVAHGDQSVVDSLRKFLARLGHECRCTTDPMCTLQLAIASPPDLIVLGGTLPEMTGATLLELTRCLLGAKCPPIVYAPAASGEEFVAEISAALPSAFVFGTGHENTAARCSGRRLRTAKNGRG